jgi:hypothetical protein
MRLCRFFNGRPIRPTIQPDGRALEGGQARWDSLHYFPAFDDLVLKVEEVLLKFSNSCRKVVSLFGFMVLEGFEAEVIRLMIEHQRA